MNERIWCTVLHDFRHNTGPLFKDEVRYLLHEDAEFLRSNGVVSTEKGPTSSYGNKVVEMQPMNGTIGLRSN
jgi:hypothetical protein